MATPVSTMWGGVLGWAGLHAAGGRIGGIIGTILVNALLSRNVIVIPSQEIVTTSSGV